MHTLFKSILVECWWRLYRGQARYQAAGQCSPNPRPLLCPARSSHQQLSPTSGPACSHVTRPSQSQHSVLASANLAVLLTSVSTPSMNKIYTKYEYYKEETVSTCGSQMQLRCGASEAVGPATCLWIAVLRHEDYEDACKTYLSSTNRETFSHPKPNWAPVFTLCWLELLQCWMLTEDTRGALAGICVAASGARSHAWFLTRNNLSSWKENDKNF